MNQIRAFIALDLPPRFQESIEQQTAHFRQVLGGDFVRWVPVCNMHLTLKFLGNIPASHLDFLKQMLFQTAAAHSRFDLQIGGVGSFPNSKRPRVLWLGIHASSALTALCREVVSGAARLGYEADERPFSPHLTLGRVRQGLDSKQLQQISGALASANPGRIGAAEINSIHLYQSELRPEGSRYTRLFSAPLR